MLWSMISIQLVVNTETENMKESPLSCTLTPLSCTLTPLSCTLRGVRTLPHLHRVKYSEAYIWPKRATLTAVLNSYTHVCDTFVFRTHMANRSITHHPVTVCCVYYPLTQSQCVVSITHHPVTV